MYAHQVIEDLETLKSRYHVNKIWTRVYTEDVPKYIKML